MDPDILGPGNNRDAIPPIYQPQFESVESADSWLENDDLVGVLALDYEVHVYPLRMLVYHEVANDQIASVPVLVTFCPLCDTVIAFDRRVTGEALLFGVSRKLLHDNLIMWDHQTESWRQQASGIAIVGDLAGEQLDFLPIRTLFWRDVRQNMPRARVLSRESGIPKSKAGFYNINVPHRLLYGATAVDRRTQQRGPQLTRPSGGPESEGSGGLPYACLGPTAGG